MISKAKRTLQYVKRIITTESKLGEIRNSICDQKDRSVKRIPERPCLAKKFTTLFPIRVCCKVIYHSNVSLNICK